MLLLSLQLTNVKMDQRDNHYYKANEATINLDEIASCEGNAKILQRLRDGDEELNSITITLDKYLWYHNPFVIKAGMEDEVGWLGYFIGKSKCLQQLSIYYMPKGQRQTRALIDGIARNQSIRTFRVDTGGLSDEEYSIIIAALINLSQLEVLHLSRSNYHCCSALGKVLSSRTMKLKELLLSGHIGDIGVASLGNGFATIGPFLKTLDLLGISIGNDGLMAVVRALANCTGLEILNLSGAAGLESLSDWLQRKQMNLKELDLNTCGINDDGLQALAEVANNCEELNLSEVDETYNAITATGLSHLSRVLQSESCRLQRLYLDNVEIGDDGAEALAAGLAGNQSLRGLYFDTFTNLMVSGWSAFSTALCDTSSINNTYLSNHYVGELWYDDYDDEEYIDENVLLYLRLNKQHQQHAAKCKILMNHRHLDMKPFLRWDLKFLPLAVAWFESAKPCTTLSIRDSKGRVLGLGESDEAFQSRVLSAMYEFVRGASMDVVKSRKALTDDEENKRLMKDKKRLREDVEQRVGKIARLEEENKRLGKIIESAKRSLSA